MKNLTSVSFLKSKPPEINWLAKVHIRTLVKADLPLLEWEGEYARFRNMYKEIYRRANQGKSVLWVADLEAVGIIGQVFIQLKTYEAELADGENRAYLHSFRIREQYRRAGLGSQMARVLEADLLARGFSQISLNVAKNNPSAVRLYQSLGYEIIGSDPGEWSYYDEKNQLQHVSEIGWRMLKNL
ncbi:MAG: GNAT family N-acetyltransferase [Chloroflexota bacterium]